MGGRKPPAIIKYHSSHLTLWLIISPRVDVFNKKERDTKEPIIDKDISLDNNQAVRAEPVEA
jgi:hypothetical protein